MNNKPVKWLTLILLIYLSVSLVIDIVTANYLSALYAAVAVFFIIFTYEVGKRGEFMTFTLLFLLLFETLAIYTGNHYDLYKRVWWYDVVLHFASGFVSAAAAADLLLPKSKNPNDALFTAFFAFVMALAIAGFWEIIEFFFDIIGKTDVQRNLISEREIFGSAWQNPGIKDTMNDIIDGFAGGIIGAVYVFFSRRKKRQ